MEVFISWSGERGKFLADIISNILDRSNHAIRPWVSQRIEPGGEWLRELNSKLEQAAAAIIIVTPEGRRSEWLHFEAGALRQGKTESGAERLVIPLCFELGTHEISSPLSQLQSRIFDHDAVLEIVLKFNGMLPDQVRRHPGNIQKTFDTTWKEEFLDRLPELSAIRLSYDESFGSLLESLTNIGCGERKYTNSYQFDTGFEDWQLYDLVFRHARERLWILGRKNRKVFDKSHNEFFAGLVGRPEFRSNVRFMFLSPAADHDVISTAHKDDDFPEQLQQSLRGAHRRLSEFGLNADELCRFYKTMRNYHVVVCDNAVLYAPVLQDADGRAESLTKSGFEVTDFETETGAKLIRLLDLVWQNGEPFSSVI